MGRGSSNISPRSMDQTGVSLSSMDSNAGGDDEDLSFSMERLETVSFHNDSSASSRGKDYLDKTSTTPAPSLPYATSNDDLLNGDDIPIARPVGFEVSSENNSTSFNGKAAFI